ncbi:MAG: right-handed parallel beta-helix repeat-containing protein [Verrucomicrobiales bacterium]|nr:right-handed parallel beta-helix repeat-containing protein [Verrucomicrobiales bacterium]
MKIPLHLLLTCALSISAYAGSVMDSGAKGDGTTDDTAAIQQAIDAGGSIVLPKGTYRLTQTITVDLQKTGFAALTADGTARIVMEGAGPAFHFIGTHEGTAAPESVKPTLWEKERTPMVEGLEITGTHPEADGIEATGTMQLTLSRVSVRDCRHAVHLTTRNRNILIADCHFYHNTGIGIFYDNVNLHQSNIIGCHISYNGGGGIVSHGGNVRNVHIGTCDIEGNHAIDGPPAANILLDSTGGSIGEVAITGCTIQHTHKAADSANIRILGGGTDEALEKRTGEKTTREGNVTITGNVFSDVQVNVEIHDSRGITISGNTFWEGFQRDLVVDNSTHIVVTGNNFDRSPRYAVNGTKNEENNGILFTNCTDTSLTGNVIAGVWRQQAAVEFKGGSRLHIAHNSILDSDGNALRIEGVTQSLISDNILRDDRPTETRSQAPSLLILNCNDNLIGSNLLSNGKKIE